MKRSAVDSGRLIATHDPCRRYGSRPPRRSGPARNDGPECQLGIGVFGRPMGMFITDAATSRYWQVAAKVVVSVGP